jgi:hypothetical protein
LYCPRALPASDISAPKHFGYKRLDAMVSTVLGALTLVGAWCVYKYFAALRRNILIARRSGIPYVVYRMSLHLVSRFEWLTYTHRVCFCSRPPPEYLLADHKFLLVAVDKKAS